VERCLPPSSIGETGADNHRDVRCVRTVGLWGLLKFSLVPAGLEQYNMHRGSQHCYNTKELIPIVMAAAMWGKAWGGLVVCCRCDNDAVVAVVNRRTSRDQDLMHLLRCLSFFEAAFSFRVVASHIPGVENTLADDLSRNKLSSFLQAMGQSHQSIPPQPLLDMLVNYKPDWTSPAWRRLFSTTLRMV